MTCSADEPIPIDKKCSKCQQRKLLSEFNLAHESSDNRALICKTCPSSDQDLASYDDWDEVEYVYDLIDETQKRSRTIWGYIKI